MNTTKALGWTAFFAVILFFVAYVLFEPRRPVTSQFEAVQKALRNLQSSLEKGGGAEEAIRRDLETARIAIVKSPLDVVQKASLDAKLSRIRLDAVGEDTKEAAARTDRLVNIIDLRRKIESLAVASAELDLDQNRASSNSIARLVYRDIRAFFFGLVNLGAWFWSAILLSYWALRTSNRRKKLYDLAMRVGVFKVGPGGVEVALAEKDRSNVMGQVVDLRKKVNRDFELAASRAGIIQALESLINEQTFTEFFVSKDPRGLPDFRLTVHIRDSMYSNTLYQLTGYVPVADRRGGGAGRTKSIHYGGIGRAWRSDGIAWENDVEYDSLRKEFAMTASDAASKQERRAYAGVLVWNSASERIAVIYFDCKQADVFEDDEQKRRALMRCVSEHPVTALLINIDQEMQGNDPITKIHEAADSLVGV